MIKAESKVSISSKMVMKAKNEERNYLNIKSSNLFLYIPLLF